MIEGNAVREAEMALYPRDKYELFDRYFRARLNGFRRSVRIKRLAKKQRKKRQLQEKREMPRTADETILEIVLSVVSVLWMFVIGTILIAIVLTIFSYGVFVLYHSPTLMELYWKTIKTLFLHQ